jgi:hypothetical protein
MFYASEVFAPKCQIDGQPVGVWLRERYNNAYGRWVMNAQTDADNLTDWQIESLHPNTICWTPV